jgi:hypothetical protein
MSYTHIRPKYFARELKTKAHKEDILNYQITVQSCRGAVEEIKKFLTVLKKILGGTCSEV